MELEDDSDEDSDEDSTVCDDVMACDSLESGSSCGDEELLSQPKIPQASRERHRCEILVLKFFIRIFLQKLLQMNNQQSN